MNIFVLDLDPKTAAKYHCNKHVIKMQAEHAQMMSSVLHSYNLGEGFYRNAYPHHPCTRWVGQSRANWHWLRELSIYLNEQYQHRWSTNKTHRSTALVLTMPDPKFLPDVGITTYAQAMPEEVRVPNDPVTAYRQYYKLHKSHLANWNPCPVPDWYNEESQHATI